MGTGNAEKQLLFCDTFTHEGEEGQLHVDMVKFTPPVHVYEVRIVPLNVRAHANNNEVDKIGHTQPSHFTLDVYTNDSSNPLAPNFSHLGIIEYKPGTISLEAKPKNFSDQVVVRGHYTVLSLSIYGISSAPLSQSPSPRRSASPYTNSESNFSDSERKEGRGTGDGGDEKTFELFEPFSPVNSPDHLFDLSDEEILPSKRSTTASGGYEELSDEDVSFDGDFDTQEGVDSYYGEEGWLTSGVGFDPYQCVFTQLESFQLSTDTPHEVLLEKLQKTDLGSKRGGTDEASKLRDIILKQRDQNQPLKWVEMLEEVPSYLYPGLAQLQKKSSVDGKEVMQKLVSWTLQCLDLDTAYQLPIAVNIRHLKAGLRLVPSIASLGRKCASSLVKHGVMEKLCDLVMAENVASTLKLLSLRAVDSLLDYPQGMERFLGWNRKEMEDGGSDMMTPYQKILDLVLSDPTPRVCYCSSVLLKKAHIGELLGRLQDAVDKIVTLKPSEATPSSKFYNLYESETEKIDPETSEGENVVPQQGELEIERAVGSVEGEHGSVSMSDEKDEVKKESQSSGADREEEEEHLMDEGGESDEREEKAIPPLLPEEDVRNIVQYLEELRKCLEKASNDTVQLPIKAFPTSIYCFPESKGEFFPPLVRTMQARRLLKCLLVLLTSPSTIMEMGIFAAVRDLLLFFLSTQDGILFLSSKPLVMNAMARALTQTVDEMPLNAMLPLTEFLDLDEDENNSESCTAQNLGLLLTYHLQVLQSLDILRKASKLNMSELESAECIGSLHTLYTMTLTPIGKCAVCYTLSLSDNILVLLPFIEPRQQRDHDNKLTKSSVSSRYAAVLLLQVFKSEKHTMSVPVGPVRLDCLFSCGSKLLSAAEFFKDNSSPLMSDLYNWLSPVKELSSGDSSKVIPALVNIIKEKTPNISCNKPGKASSPIMTAIRLLLCYVTPAPSAKGTQRDPKLTHCLIHLFSSNCLETLLTLLNKFSDIVLPVWSQRQSLPVSHASILVSLTTFTLQLLKELLGSLLVDGSYQFGDTRVASTLLKVHMVLCSAQYSTVASNAAPEILVLIVDILVMYTKPKDVILEGEDRPDISQNCWCLMLKEVFQHTLSSPHCYLSGLMVLSELLPLPLPTPTSYPISGDQLLNKRKLWALHLDPFLSSIMEMVQIFLLSSANALQQMLRRVCAQLADISASLAILIIQQIISNILVEIEKQLEREEPESMDTTGSSAGEERGDVSGDIDNSQGKEEKKTGEGQDAEKIGDNEQIRKTLNSPLLRNLTTCAVLCQQPAIKIALLDIISQKETASTKGFTRFIPLLLFLVQRKETAVQLKLCIMFILNALCSMYISLNASEMEEVPPLDQQLSNCLPPKSKLEHITSAVLGHVTSPEQPLATMMLGLKVILALCQYDVGLLNVYRLIPTHVKGFAFILERLADTVRSSTPPSTDTISCVSLFLQLLGHLLSSEVTGRAELPSDSTELLSSPSEDAPGGGGQEKRRDSHYEMRSVSFSPSLLKMIVYNENGESLLGKLRDALEINCKEDASLLTEFTKIIATLEQEFDGVEPGFPDLVQLEYRSWPPMQNVETQFEFRNVVTLSVSPPSPDYWMASPPHDENELEPDTATRDLNRLASHTCSGLNLEEELKKHLLPSPPRTPPRNDRKRKIALTGPEAQKRLKEAIQQRMLQGPKRDLFRLRKQNTSRPPSMHVDDFMAKSTANRNRGVSRDHSIGSGPDSGRGGPFQYIPQPGMFLPHMGGRWLGAVPPSLNYPRRDMSGLGGIRSSWDTRGIPFLSASQLKSSAALSRNVSMYSALQAYSRAGGSGRGPILWPTAGGRSSLSSSRQSDSSSSGHKSSSSSSSRHAIYKRLV